jgi:hypothetical protein
MLQFQTILIRIRIRLSIMMPLRIRLRIPLDKVQKLIYIFYRNIIGAGAGIAFFYRLRSHLIELQKGVPHLRLLYLLGASMYLVGVIYPVP